MKVLWLTHTPAGASNMVNFNEPGRGWISSLEELFTDMDNITLGIAFFADKKTAPFEIGKTTYYPVLLKYTSVIGKLIQRIFTLTRDVNVKSVLAIIEEFKPDIIHLFGTESGIGDLNNLTSVPIIVHMQGLVNPYLNNWHPNGISNGVVFRHSSFRSLLFRRGLYFEYKLFKKRAKRELRIVKYRKYFFGRTGWDKNFLGLCKKDLQYYHCNEVLRPLFYLYEWQRVKKEKKKLTIITTVSPQLYKGIDIVLNTAKILTEISDLNFEWIIVGVKENDEVVLLMESIFKLKFKNVNVRFVGHKNEYDLIQQLLVSDIFVHPSHIDNSPNSICEAMMLGMPVIAGYVGGIPSLIEDGVSGILYNSNDSYELAAKILNLNDDEACIARLSYNARVRSIDRHCHDKIKAAVILTYQDVLDSEKLIEYEQC
jgi:glycosyltransferase involved in cell wall biosynthesis